MNTAIAVTAYMCGGVLFIVVLLGAWIAVSEWLVRKGKI